jgi:SAM-dependent methyltransferase
VLDLGCGSGATTARLSASVAPEGRVLGIDISPDQIDIANQRFGGGRIVFQVADAQTFAFEPERFDAIFSRFGCMFFDDPQVAFRNLAGALLPVGRVVLVVWRDISLNPWAELPAKVGDELFGPAEPAPPGAPGPFAWADPSVFEPVLRRAGLREITWSGVDTTLKLGRKAEPDAVQRAVDMLLCVGPLARRLRDQPEAARVEAARRLAPRLQAYLQDGWVRMPGAIWVIEAHR